MYQGTQVQILFEHPTKNPHHWWVTLGQQSNKIQPSHILTYQGDKIKMLQYQKMLITITSLQKCVYLSIYINTMQLWSLTVLLQFH